MFSNFHSLEKLYAEEVQSEIEKQAGISFPTISEQSISGLPEPVQKYFRTCGYIGKKSMKNVRITWKSAFIKMSPDKEWMTLDCYQFNSVPEPVRIVLMKSKIAGILPFEGRDKYQSGHGNMLIKLLKIFKVVDIKTNKMDESALVTLLAETFLAPSYALQDYIRWESINSTRAKATLTFNETCVNGFFHFKETGEFIRFDTDCRWRNENDSTPTEWSAFASEYVRRNGIKFPTDLRAVWHDDNADFEYFNGEIEELEYNVR